MNKIWKRQRQFSSILLEAVTELHQIFIKQNQIAKFVHQFWIEPGDQELDVNHIGAFTGGNLKCWSKETLVFQIWDLYKNGPLHNTLITTILTHIIHFRYPTSIHSPSRSLAVCWIQSSQAFFWIRPLNLRSGCFSRLKARVGSRIARMIF